MANHSTSCSLIRSPGRVADDGVEAALRPGVLPAAPHAGEGDLPVEETLVVGDGFGGAPGLLEGRPEGTLLDCVLIADAVGTVRYQLVGPVFLQGESPN